MKKKMFGNHNVAASQNFELAFVNLKCEISWLDWGRTGIVELVYRLPTMLNNCSKICLPRNLLLKKVCPTPARLDSPFAHPLNRFAPDLYCLKKKNYRSFFYIFNKCYWTDAVYKVQCYKLSSKSSTHEITASRQMFGHILMLVLRHTANHRLVPFFKKCMPF